MITAICVCSLAFATAGAQVSIVLQVPPVGVMQKNQLWNMALINAGGPGVSVTIQLTLLDARDGQPVMTAQTRPVLLTKGTTMITAREVTPVHYDYPSPQFNVDRDPNGFLPVGNYKACYSIVQASHSEGRLTEDCIPIEVQPLSPPQLNSPADTSMVATAYPQFSWLPPTPINLFSNLSYEMMLVEVLPDQGPYQAIQQNIPVYNISHLKDPVNLYPASGTPLDTGRLYAWRILALNDEQFIAQSEVWTFRLATPVKTPLMVPGGHYMSMRPGNEPSAGVHVLTSDTIGCKFYSFEKDHPAMVNFYGADGKLVKATQEKIVYGDNFLVYVLSRDFEKGKVYRVEIADSKKNIYTASFSLTTTK